MSLVSRVLERDGAASVTAVLGPTNTGKTHRAIQRMLEHGSGMIGLPLRLLAREVYDRVCAERSPDQVALVTGEEKRIPDNPRYFVCTVEAMPLDRRVAFVAVDEVQLAADRTRGHVFTDRILHARGLLETQLLGADTIEPLLEQLVPGLDVVRQPRLSELTYAGSTKLNALPRRSAVVGFSVDRVYELADRLRARHGGVAVVLGALSPRARNAQVAMFQSGEVPFMVATDAIGMGLNLDLDHVAFTDLGKFDGIGYRALAPAEVAQIAGRAGRYRRDGTFGTTDGLGDLEIDLVQAVEAHRFGALDLLFWRNHDLDYRSPGALLASLGRRPPRPFLVRMRDAEDHRTLEALAARPEVRDRATGHERVALLWEVCQVPDFRKTLTGSHADLLSRVYLQLVDDLALDPDWVSRRIDRLDRVDGDIDVLTTRMAFVRTWSYLANRRDWMPDAAHWQARTRAIEDRLSDALHEALTRRFVNRRAMVLTERRITGDRVADLSGMGTFDGLVFRPEPDVQQDKGLLKAVRAAARDELSRRAAALLSEDPPAFELGADGTIGWGGAEIGRWTRGPHRLEPRPRQRRHELLGASDRERLGRALDLWTATRLATVLDPLRDHPRLTPASLALLHALRAGLGTVPRDGLDLDPLDTDRNALARRGIRLGRHVVYVLPLAKPEPVAVRNALYNVWQGTAWAAPDPGATSAPVHDRPDDAWWAIGFVPLGPRALRADVVEKVAARARKLARGGPFDLPEDVLSWVGCTRDELAEVLVALGLDRHGDPPRFSTRSAGRRPVGW